MFLPFIYTQQHFGDLKTQTFVNDLKRTRFWKQYCYHLCVNYKKCDFVETLTSCAHVITCLVYRDMYVHRHMCLCTNWPRHLLAWHEYYNVIFSYLNEQRSFWPFCISHAFWRKLAFSLSVFIVLLWKRNITHGVQGWFLSFARIGSDNYV